MRWIMGVLFFGAFVAGVGVGRGWSEPRTVPVAVPVEAPPGAIGITDVPAVPEGDGRITGIVRDPGGTPLAGVVLIAEPDPPHWSEPRKKAPPPPVERELEPLLREWEGSERWRRAAQRRVTTGEDGTFVIANLGDVDYTVNGYKAGYQCQAPMAFRARPGAELVFTATPIVRLPVEIVGFDGFVRIRHETLEGDSAGSRGSSQVFPEHRWLELPPGRYKLRAESDEGDLRRESASIIVLLEAGTTPVPARFEVTAQAALRLHVTLPEEFAAHEYAARVHRIGSEGEPLGAPKAPDTRSRKAGRLVWRQLKPGRYRLGVGWWLLQDAMPGSPLEAHYEEELLVAGGVHDHSVRLDAPDLSRLFVVRVLDPAGAPLTGVKFGLDWNAKGGGGSHSRWHEAARGRSGNYYLPPLPGTGGADGTYTLEALHERFGMVAAAATLTDTEPLELRFAEPVRLTVAVEGIKDARRRERLLVELVPKGEFERPSVPDGNVDAKSRALMAPVQPGSYEAVLYIRTTDIDTRWAQLTRKTLELKPGTLEWRLWIPPLHSLRVVRKGKGRADIGLTRDDADGDPDVLYRRRSTDEDGVAVFKDLPAGRYSYFVNGSGPVGEEHEIVVPAQKSVTVDRDD